MSENKYTVKEAKEICEKFKNLCSYVPYGYGYNVYELLDTCKMLEVLGLEWGENYKMEDFRIQKYKSGNYFITNSATHYKPEPDTYYIHWDNGNIGQLQFVQEHIFYDGYNEFLEKLRSYNPVDWDPLNDHIIYDIENGKRVMADYKDIVKETRQKAREVAKQYRIKQLEAEMAKLKED